MSQKSMLHKLFWRFRAGVYGGASHRCSWAVLVQRKKSWEPRILTIHCTMSSKIRQPKHKHVVDECLGEEAFLVVGLHFEKIDDALG